MGHPSADWSLINVIACTASILIDLMVKNQMQERCGKEMIQLLEQISLENQHGVQNTFPLNVLSRASLSKGAQRNFDQMMEILKVMKVGPQAEFLLELQSQLHTMQLETLYYKTKTAQS